MPERFLELLPECLLFAACSFLFGVLLKLSDLLQEHGYEWFRGAAVTTGAVGAVLLLVVLGEASGLHRVFWLAVLLHWILRGRIDGLNHGIPTVAALLSLGAWNPTLLRDHLAPFLYFFGSLTVLGLLHDLYQYTRLPGPHWLKEFFRNQHLYWYAIIAGHVAIAPLEAPFVVSGLAFVKGYGVLYGSRALGLLPKLGIRAPS